jgi:hypothetical protein
MPEAAGDSVIGLVNFGTPRATPHFAGAINDNDSLRIVRGNNQTAPRNTVLPQRLTVRVTDDEGRPVAGTRVQFRIESGSANILGSSSSDSDASGLAEATIQLGGTPGTVRVEAWFGNGSHRREVTFTVTSQ